LGCIPACPYSVDTFSVKCRMTSDVFTLFKSEFPKSANQGIELSTVVLVEIKLYSSSTSLYIEVLFSILNEFH
jgi:hypothetical protein